MAKVVQQGLHKPAQVTEFVADTMASLGEVQKEKYLPGSEAYCIANGNTYILGEDVEWHKKSTGSGGGGGSGADGEDGATFTPSVSEDGVISWTNDKLLPNPDPVNIKGADGTTPHIDATTKNWFIGETNTGVNAAGAEYMSFETHTAFPNQGVENKLYIATDENQIYRYDATNSIYVALAPVTVTDEQIVDALDDITLNVVVE